jgi:hypothetical protein
VSWQRQTPLVERLSIRISGVEKSLMQKTRTISCTMLRRDRIANRDIAGPIWARMTRLRDTATSVTQYATPQEEYADALLDICVIGRAGRYHAYNINRIVRKVASYPAVVGKEWLESKVEDASEKCTRR